MHVVKYFLFIFYVCICSNGVYGGVGVKKHNAKKILITIMAEA
jgi:hypothetical protein